VSDLERFELGVAEFNEGRFFESHDTFEELWRDARGQHRIFLQGLIHLAIGLFHYSNGNARACHNHVGRAVHKLRGFPLVYENVSVSPLIESLQTLQIVVLSALEAGLHGYDPALVPRIPLVSSVATADRGESQGMHEESGNTLGV
jgi:uncharacterized protein